jgi:hypothetical protein
VEGFELRLNKNGFILALVFLFALGVGALTANAQEEGPAAIKTRDGYLFVWNRPGLHFSISIIGQDVKPLADSDHIFFNVDGKVLQIQSLPISDFLPDKDRKGLDDKAILNAHRDWESQFVGELLHQKLNVQSSSGKLGNGSEVLLWQFDMPEAMAAEAKKQLYLTLVSKDYLLLFNSVATTTISESAAHKFLSDTVATLKISVDPINVKALQESIRKAND